MDAWLNKPIFVVEREVERKAISETFTKQSLTKEIGERDGESERDRERD